jgi:hypothetical protein
MVGDKKKQAIQKLTNKPPDYEKSRHGTIRGGHHIKHYYRITSED